MVLFGDYDTWVNRQPPSPRTIPHGTGIAPEIGITQIGTAEQMIFQCGSIPDQPIVVILRQDDHRLVTDPDTLRTNGECFCHQFRKPILGVSQSPVHDRASSSGFDKIEGNPERRRVPGKLPIRRYEPQPSAVDRGQVQGVR